jgi:subtilisin family serine protease
MRRLTLVLAAALLSMGLWAQPKTETVPTFDGSSCAASSGDVLIKFRAESHAHMTFSAYRRMIAALEKQLDGKFRKQPGVPRLHHFVSRSKSTAALMAVFDRRDDVEYVEPNCAIGGPLGVVPGDPYFVTNGLTNQPQWHLANQNYGGAGSTADIGAEAAWSYTTGLRNYPIAVTDWDIDCSHPDLGANCWAAPAAFSVTVNGTTYNCPQGTVGFDTAPARYGCGAQISAGKHYHGTMVMGSIGALGNNAVGVSGVLWTTSLVALRIGNAGGTTTTQHQIDGLEVARQLKVNGVANIRFLNASWTNYGAYSQALTDEIKALGDADILVFMGSANNGANNDASPIYPQSQTVSLGCSQATANCPLSNLVTVGSIQDDGTRSTWANYGATSVQIAAPGYKIVAPCLAGASNPVTFQVCPAYATGNSYQFDNGTSFSGPIAAGVAALVAAACPQLTTAAQIKSVLLSTVHAEPTLSGYVSTGGYVRADAAVASCGAVPSRKFLKGNHQTLKGPARVK